MFQGFVGGGKPPSPKLTTSSAFDLLYKIGMEEDLLRKKKERRKKKKKRPKSLYIGNSKNN